jgi:hypothetical protein
MTTVAALCEEQLPPLVGTLGPDGRRDERADEDDSDRYHSHPAHLTRLSADRFRFGH